MVQQALLINSGRVAMINILSTTDLSDVVLETDLDEHFTIDSVNFIATKPNISCDALCKIRKVTHEKIVAVFTSMNAVEAVGRINKTRNALWKIYCLGAKTMDYVIQYFPNSIIQGTATNALELANVMIADGIKQEVYFFCGNIKRDDLPLTLSSAQIKLHEVVVYETHQLKQEIEKPYDAVLFFSPSAVESFFALNHLPAQTITFAIGKTTAEAIRKCCDNQVVVPGTLSKRELLRESISYFKN